MTNLEALKQMPLKNFAQMIFDIVKRDCETEDDFVEILEREIPIELEQTVKVALQSMQRSSTD